MGNGFHEVQFPPGISYGFSGGPEYSTDVVTTDSGYEQRNINWATARAKYTASFSAIPEAMKDTLLAFFRNRYGKAYGFRYKDWADYIGIGQYLGKGDGTNMKFPLQKTYIDHGGYGVVRKITKPVAGSVIVYVNSVVVSFTVDTTTGIVTLAQAPAQNAVVSADFEFDVPVRFDSDYNPTSEKNWNVYGSDNIQIVEIRV